MRNVKKAEELPQQKNARLFLAEGVAFTILSAFSMNLTNLFLTRIHASDFEIGIYTMLTQLLGMLFLVPLAFLGDRLKNKRRAMCAILIFIAVCFSAAAATPFLQQGTTIGLVVLAAFGSGSIALYTSLWQSFFADVIHRERLNSVYAARNRVTFVTNLIAGLLAGGILSSVSSEMGKVRTHQLLFLAAAGFAFIETAFLSRIEGGDGQEEGGVVFRNSFRQLFHNRKYLVFLGVVSFFYLTWKLDGTIFYLAQVQYIGLSEFWLSVSSAVNAMGQILTVGFWAKVNERMGCRFGLIFGALGMTLSPVCVIIPLLMPGSERIIMHIVLRFVTDLGFTTIQLNILQNLLQVVDEKSKTMAIAVYTMATSLLSALLPVAGVVLYTSLGASEQGMSEAFSLIAFVRIFSLAALCLRWYSMRREKET